VSSLAVDDPKLADSEYMMKLYEASLDANKKDYISKKFKGKPLFNLVSH
jgi:hypothetical protein